MSNSYTWEPSPDSPEKLDPYSKWLQQTESARFERASSSDAPWFLALKMKSGKDAKKAKVPGATAPGSLVSVWEPEGSDYVFELTRQPHTANGKQKNISELYVQLAPLDDDSVAGGTVLDPSTGDAGGPAIDAATAVIVGLIDDGINIAHEHFVDPSGHPRIDYAWLQDGKTDSSSAVLFGREFTASDIKAARAGSKTEEGTLRALGLVAPAKEEPTTLSKSFSHGTFVLDCLAGYPSSHQLPGISDPGEAVNPADRRIVSVQLHRRVTEESSGALYPMFAIAGLQYIVDRARRVAKETRKGKGRKIPLVVNFSYGISGGPHNGEHLFEQYVDQLVTSLQADKDLGPLIMPMPTGNRHLLEGHAHVEADKTDKLNLDLSWIIQPQDRTPNYLEIWVPKPAKANGKNGPSHRVAVSLKPPFGGNAYAFSETFNLANFKNGDGQDLQDDQGNVVARVTLDALDADNTDEITQKKADTGQYAKIRILIALAPTYPARDGTAHIPPGHWSVSVSTKVKAGQFIEAWVQRDDSPPQFRRHGRQSYLENRTDPKGGRTKEELTEFLLPLGSDAGLSRYGAINGLATGQNMLRVSGVRHHDNNLPALYSGATHKGMRSIEVAAPSDRSLVFRGVVGTGGRSGSTQIMNGTSVAAPIVGRALADFLSQHTFTDAESAMEKFVQNMTQSANTSRQPSPGGRRLAEEILALNPELKRQRTGDPLKIGTDASGNPNQPAQQAGLPPSLRR